MTIYPLPLLEEEYTLTDEKVRTTDGAEILTMSAADKWQVLQDWRRFLLSGFEKLFLTPTLHHYLVTHCGFGLYNREQFWLTHCANSVDRLQALLAQFGGDRRSAEQGHHRWLTGSTTDLKEAMCREAALLYAPLTQVLRDLELKHQDMIATWQEFALAANITEAALPPRYQVSENTRHLLAYAAQIALKHQRPLTGLQMMFPLAYQPLLQPATINTQDTLMKGG